MASPKQSIGYLGTGKTAIRGIPIIRIQRGNHEVALTINFAIILEMTELFYV